MRLTPAASGAVARRRVRPPRSRRIDSVPGCETVARTTARRDTLTLRRRSGARSGPGAAAGAGVPAAAAPTVTEACMSGCASHW